MKNKLNNIRFCHVWLTLVLGAACHHTAADPPPYTYAQHHELLGLKENASGVTYLPAQNHLLVVVDNPECLIQFDLNGKLQHKIQLSGFKDVEAVTYLKDDLVAVAEEGRMRVTFVPLGPTKVAQHELPSFTVDRPLPKDNDNKGIEGLAYDPATDTLYACKEGKPRKIYQITHATNPALRKVSEWKTVDLNTLPAEDLSGLHFDPTRQLLHLVSDESRRWLTINQAGKVTAQISLDKDDTGAAKSMKKAEGVTLDPAQKLYIVGEPNWLFVFEPADK